MKINQSFLSKVGWGFAGLRTFYIVRQIFFRYEMRDAALLNAKNRWEVIAILERCDDAVHYMTVEWIIIAIAAAIIAIILYRMLPLYAGVAAGIATLFTELLGPACLYCLREYEIRYHLFSVWPVITVTTACCATTIIILTLILYVYNYVDKRV